MMEYAKIMGYSSPMIKEAWDWGDVANSLGLTALTDVGLMGGLGYFGVAGGLTGAGAATGTAGAAAAIAGGPIGWVLLAGGVAFAIYQGTRLADNRVKDLLERIEALDYEDTDAQSVVEKWKTDLASFLPYFQVQMAPDPNKPGEVVNQARQQLGNIERVATYLNQMALTWPQVKPLLTDPFYERDITQFENALTKTTAAINQQLADIKQRAQQAAQQLIAQKGQATGVDLVDVAKDIIALEARVQQSGEKPIYEKTDIDERVVRNFVNKVINESATEEEINQYVTPMVALRDRMRNSLQRMEAKQQAKPSRNRPASAKPYISKRAFRTSSEPPSAAAPGATRGRVGKNPQVTLLQRLINRLNIALKTGIDRIEEDGAYGVNTAAAFTGLVAKSPELDDYLRKYAGLDEKSIVDFKVMSNPENVSDAVRVLYSYLQKVVSADGTAAPANLQTQQDPTQGVMCNPNKANPSPEEVSACLRSIIMNDPKSGREVSLYMFLQDRGMSEQAMREYIYRKYRARAPRDWSWSEIADDFKEGRYSF